MNKVNSTPFVFKVDIREGLRDQIKGTSPAVANAARYIRNRKGVAVGGQYKTYSGLNYTLDASAKKSEGVLFILARIKAFNNSFLEFAYNLHGVNMFFDASRTFGMYQYIGGAGFKTSGKVISDNNFHVFAVKFQSTTTNGCKFYVDGSYVGQNTVILGDDLSVLAIASGPDAGYSGGSEVMFCALSGDYNMSEQDISEISTELLLSQGAGDPKTRNYKGFIDTDKSAVSEWTAQKTADNLVLDLTGNGNNGTITNTVVKTSKNGFPAISTSNGGYVNVATTSSPPSDAVTFEYIGSLDALPSGFTTLVGVGSGQVASIYVSSAGVVLCQIGFIVGGSKNFNGPGLSLGRIYHLAFRWSTGNKMELFVDGVKYSESTLAFTDTFIGTGMAISRYQSGVTANATCILARIYNRSITDAEIQNHYRQFAKHLLYSAQPEYWLPTLADVSAGEISNTGFKRNSGTWKVSEDSNKKKWIENVVVGNASRNSNETFGTYVFEVNLSSFAAENSIGFISSANGGYASYTGYAIYILSTGDIGVLRCTGGGSAGLIQSAVSYISASTTYKLAVSRSSTGIFKLYIKGGVYTSWTLVGTSIADLTYTTSKKLNFYTLNTGTKFRMLGIHQGVLTIPELTEIYN